MARTIQSRSAGASIGVLLIASLFAVAAFGQNAAAPTNPRSPVPAPYSPECQSGGNEIDLQTPLPYVVAALQKRKAMRILAIGPSARWRSGGSSSQIEIMLKQILLGFEITMINRGVSGELAAHAATRIKTEVALNDPDLVLWPVGTNDALSYIPLDELQQTVEETVRWLKAHNVDVVLVGLQYVDSMAQDDHYKAVRDMLRTVAAKENVMIIRRYEAMQFIAATQKTGGGFVPDEFDRTEAGYNCLAQYVASAITLGTFGREMDQRRRSPTQ
jgi:acyl-CoA thioesterase I